MLPSTTPSLAAISGIPMLPPEFIAWEFIDVRELLPEQLHQATVGTPITSSVVILPESSYQTHR